MMEPSKVILLLLLIMATLAFSSQQLPPPLLPPGNSPQNVTDYCAVGSELPPTSSCPSCTSRCGQVSTEDHLCSCDPECKVYGDCCTDFTETCPSENTKGLSIPSQDHKKYTVCIKYGGYKQASLIAECLNGSRCHREPSDINQGIPVTDVTTGYQYLNAECAICNNVRKAKPWSANVSCLHGGENIANLTDLMKALAEKKCTLKAGKPVDGYKTRACLDNIISDCLLPCMNSQLVDLCKNSGIQAYTSGTFQTFKNYYCTMCAPVFLRASSKCGVVITQPTSGMEDADQYGLSINFIFDFNPEKGLTVGSDKDKGQDCPEGSVWVPEEKTCRKISCQPGFIPVENQCVPNELNYTINAMVQLGSRSDTDKLVSYLEDSTGWKDTLNNDIQNLFNHQHPGDGKISSAFEMIENGETSVNITSYIVIVLSRNNTFNETDLADFLPAVKENIRARMFEILQQLDIDTTTTEMIFDNRPVTFPSQRLDCTWVVYNSSEYHMNGSVLYLKATGVGYDYTRYEVDGDIALVCVSVPDKGGIHYPASSDAFTIIITICTVLSIICLSIRIGLQFFFSYFRSFAGRLQFHLCVALCLAYLFLLIGGIFISFDLQTPCMVLGLLTYFFFLAAFGWMTAIALNTWVVFRPSSSFIKADDRSQSIARYALIGWAIPVILTLVVLGLDFVEIDPRFKPSFGTRLCWINQRYALLVYFGVPVAFCVTTNIVLFVLTVCVLRKTFKDSVDTSNTASSEMHHVGIYIRLFILMGLSWGLGFIAAFTGLLAIWILYAVLNASQGILIFISFVCRRQILKMILAGRTKADYSSDSRSHATKSTSAGAHEGIALTKHGRLDS